MRTFAGAVMQFTVTGVTAQTIPAGKHLEIWARTKYDDIVRVDGYYDLANAKSSFGVMVRPAISLSDPCMLDGYYFNTKGGNLLTSPAAYAASTNAGGVTQTPDQQALQVKNRIAELTSNPTIQTGGPLLAVLPYDPNVPPAIRDGATPDERRAACDAYEAASELTYIANPYQINGPLHGFVYGFVKFVSVTPPTNYDGFRIDTPLHLDGVREIFLTVEGPTVDANNRGPLFLISQKTQGGRDVTHFDLIHPSPMGTASGTVAILTDLDSDPVQF